jgi:hypothetical protein
MAVADLLRRDEADGLVREAHLNVHRYPPDFPGFRARLRLSTEEAVATGHVVVPADGPVRADVDTDPGIRAWLDRELALMIDHRRHRPYEEGDGRWDKDVHDAPDAPLGRVVHLADPLHSSYRVERGQITRVARTLPVGRLTIIAQDQAAAPDGRRVTSDFVVVIQDEGTGAIASVDAYHDDFAEVDGVLLPALRRVTSMSAAGTAVRAILLERHEVTA